MKTENLISAIVEDTAARPPWLAARVTVALASGGAVAAAIFAFGLGIRPDIAIAMETWRFLTKLAVVLTCLVLALWASTRLARPDVAVRKVLAGLAIAPLLLAVAVGYELMTVPAAEWQARAIGSNSRICLVAVPLLSVAPLVALLIALRAGAPRSPVMAGAVAGLLAGALAATLYATHCVDDSPLFVALWYTPTIAFAALIGAAAGHRALRW